MTNLLFLVCAFTFVLDVTSASNAGPTLQIGQQCIDNTTCSDPNSYCDFVAKQQCNVGVCNCLPTHVAFNSGDPSNTVCLLKATDIGDPCQQDVQCTSSFGEDSTCVFPTDDSHLGTCQCSESTVLCRNEFEGDLRRCRPTKILGEFCNEGCESNQCMHIPHASCLYGTFRCQCENGFFMLNETTCAQKAYVGGSCDISPDQCKYVHNSYCDPNTLTCKCNNATHIGSIRDTQCYPKREYLGMECKYWVEGQCLPENSICKFDKAYDGISSYVCRCDNYYVESSVTPKTCVKVVDSVNDHFCTENIQCSRSYLWKNAECNRDKNQCECKKGYVRDNTYSMEHGLCRPMSPLNGSCEISEQCFDKLGSSIWTTCESPISGNRTCQCGWQAGLFEGVCYEKVKIGDKCQIDAECKASIKGHVLCDKTTKTCSCDEGFAIQDYGSYGTPNCLQEGVLYGDNCSENWQCYGPIGSIGCVNSICKCRSGWKYSEELQHCIE